MFDFAQSKITLPECMTKLKCFGINDQLCSKVKSAINDDIAGNNLTAGELKKVIDNTIPKQWQYQTGFLNERYIDAIMHMIFYGIGASSIHDITIYLKSKKKHASF